MPKSPSELGTRLRETLDNLIDATRQVARPGWIWIVGFVYPSVVGAFEVVVDVRKKLDASERERKTALKLNKYPVDDLQALAEVAQPV